MTQPPFHVDRAHRWFAVELNNLAWDPVEATELSSTDTDRMIHAAHAAYHHWLQVGDLLNPLRAQVLLATVYGRLNLPAAATRHAEQCLALSAEAGVRQTLFDRATVHGCVAAAYAASGRVADAKSEHAVAAAIAAGFSDQAGLAVFNRCYPVR